jgi:hypothetical protein
MRVAQGPLSRARNRASPLSPRGLAEAFGVRLGKNVVFEQITPEQFRTSAAPLIGEGPAADVAGACAALRGIAEQLGIALVELGLMPPSGDDTTRCRMAAPQAKRWAGLPNQRERWSSRSC